MIIYVKINSTLADEETMPGETLAKSPSMARGRPVRGGVRGLKTPSSSSEAAFPLTAE